MGYIAAALAGVVGTVVGWLAAALLAVAIGSALGVSDREGALAMSAFFAIGPIGGLTGLVLAVWFVMRRRRRKGLTATASHLGAAVAGVVVAAVLVAGGFWLTRPFTNGNGLPPELVFEILMPAGAKPPELVSRADALARRSPIELQTSENVMSAQISSVRMEGDRPIVTGRVEMAFRARSRLLVFRQPGGAVVFDIDLPRSPGHEAEFTPWQASTVLQNGVRLEGFHIRYRSALPGVE